MDNIWFQLAVTVCCLVPPLLVMALLLVLFPRAMLLAWNHSLDRSMAPLGMQSAGFPTMRRWWGDDGSAVWLGNLSYQPTELWIGVRADTGRRFVLLNDRTWKLTVGTTGPLLDDPAFVALLARLAEARVRSLVVIPDRVAASAPSLQGFFSVNGEALLPILEVLREIAQVLERHPPEQPVARIPSESRVYARGYL